MATHLRQFAYGARRRALGVRPAADTPYSTHIPVLAALSKVRPIRRVLELGSGPFSTSLFLRRDAFPDLVHLVSYEDDPDWSPVVLNKVGGDPRLDYRMVDAVRSSVPADLSSYDLIFIDDSRRADERALTIATVAARRPTGLVAVHDFETRQYRAAAKPFDCRVIFRSLTPQVGVLWNGSAEDMTSVRDARRRVEVERKRPPTDVEGWLRALA